MDHTKFTERKTGGLIELQGAFGRDWSFVPDPLPPEWKFPERLWPLLDQASSELMRLDGAGKHVPNPTLIVQPLQMREAVRSSSLEGTFADPEDVMLFEMSPRVPKSDQDEANNQLEVLNYKRALAKGFLMINSGEEFSCEMIRLLHETLMNGVRGRDMSPGQFRTVRVQIDSNARFVPPPVDEMNKCLDAFNDILKVDPRALPTELHPLVWCYLAHYQFETIHPFRDGNGRVGRVLLALMTYKHMKLTQPWLYMSAFYDKYKSEYKNNLFECSSDAGWERWIEYCLNGTLQQAQDSSRRVDAMVDLQKQYHAQFDASGGRYHAIIEELFMRPIVTNPDLQKRFKIAWPTAESDIQELCNHGVLEQLAKFKKPKVYYSPRIYEICYADDFADSETPAS